MSRNPDLPEPYHPEAVALLRGRLAEAGGVSAELLARPDSAGWIAALAGHSPFLADLVAREPAILTRLLDRGADDAFQLAVAPLARADPATARPALATLLRQVKRRAALVIAAADIGGLWPLERVTGALSTLAEQTLAAACRHLLLAGVERGELRKPAARAGKGCGLVVRGMGKLGARELNYSSDIDIILLYDPAVATEPEEAQTAFVRLARDLVKLLQERSAEGYVFRTDLRLRPDPAATPLAVSVPAAIAYYESMGATWERAAMIKARPVAGDIAAGDAFLRDIRPFIWRRHLDFAALADIHSIKRMIHAHHGQGGGKGGSLGERLEVLGHDIKLGRGGIREIEFTVQALQLIWGGRDPALREPTTMGALTALVVAGRLDRVALGELSDAYEFLRRLEHRLQMVDDRQTHRMPEDAAGLARIASFMGETGAEALAQRLTAKLAVVEAHYTHVFEGIGGATSSDGFSVPTGREDAPQAVAQLRAMGFADGASALRILRGWAEGHVRATRSERARALLAGLVPPLLESFSAEADPDAVLTRFDAMLAGLPVGVQILSLIMRNPGLLKRIATILGAAPPFADHLAHFPAAFEGLLSNDPAGPLPIAARVREARHLEEALDAVRRLATERRFEIDAALLECRLDADAAGRLRSSLAETVMEAVIPRVTTEFEIRHGRVPGGALAVLAMGKLGGQEMLPGSDLDLVLLYDHAADAETSKGGTRSLAPSDYFIRLSHQVVAALSSPGAEGALFAVDMRLRPTGNKGPVATRLSSFEAYQAGQAWSWERMALMRARVVAGPPAFRKAVEAALRMAQLRPLPPGRALADAAAMRARLLRELPPDGPWDLKAMPGGMIEVEFIAQALLLEHAPHRPELWRANTSAALAALGEAGLLPEAPELIRAERLWRTLVGLRRLMLARPLDSEISPTAEAVLLRGVGQVLGAPPVDGTALRQQIDLHARVVRAAFARHIQQEHA